MTKCRRPCGQILIRVDTMDKENLSAKMSDEELAKALGRYQAAESLCMLIGIIMVVAGCISAFVVHNRVLLAVLVFVGVGLLVFGAMPVQKKKKALLARQMGGFFDAEREKLFGKDPETPELPIDREYLKSIDLCSLDWTDITVENFHEGEHDGLRFSAANVSLSRTVEEKSGPNNDNWMSRTETLFTGLVVRCKGVCRVLPEMTVRSRFQKRSADDLKTPAAFLDKFSVGDNADSAVTVQVLEFVQAMEKAGGKLFGFSVKDGDLTLALETRYVFANVPPEVDLRDIDGIRKWYIASIKGMSDLLDIIKQTA